MKFKLKTWVDTNTKYKEVNKQWMRMNLYSVYKIKVLILAYVEGAKETVIKSQSIPSSWFHGTPEDH